MHTRACRTFVPRHALESRVNRTIECAVLRSATQTLKESHPPRPRTILYDEYLSTTRLRGAAEEKLRRDVRSWTRYNELYFLALVGALPKHRHRVLVVIIKYQYKSIRILYTSQVSLMAHGRYVPAISVYMQIERECRRRDAPHARVAVRGHEQQRASDVNNTVTRTIFTYVYRADRFSFYHLPYRNPNVSK